MEICNKIAAALFTIILFFFILAFGLLLYVSFSTLLPHANNSSFIFNARSVLLLIEYL